jgi:hypothetical protein
MDVDGANYCFVTSDYKLTATSASPTSSLPLTGLINSAATAGATYQLAPYTASNSLRLTSAAASGTLSLVTPQPASEIYLLWTSGSGASTADVTVTFTDNTTQSFTSNAVPDWYNGAGYAIQGISRVNSNTGAIENSTTNPRLYEKKLLLNSSNYSKLVASITITRAASSGGIVNVMGVSVNDVCATAPTAGTATSSVTTACWTTNINLNLTGSSNSGGITYQWQRSVDNGANWIDIPGATTMASTVNGQQVATQYRCKLVCPTASNATSYSTVVSVTQYLCYCNPSFTSGCSTWKLTNVTLGTINNSPTGTCSNNNYTTMYANLTAGVAAPMSISGGQYAGFAVYADFNKDGDFDDINELMYTNSSTVGLASATITPSITVPTYVPTDTYRLRVLCTWGTSGQVGGACNTYQYGNFHDYSIIVSNPATCSAPATVTTSNVLPFSATLNWTAPATTTPIGYQWKIVAGGALPTATAVATGTTNATTFTANATSLASATYYTGYVRSACGTASADTSAWRPVDFTTPCGGAPAAGFAAVSAATVCPNVAFTLSDTGYAAAIGISYNWQVSTNGGTTWTNIAGATTPTYTVTAGITATTQYRLSVKCGTDSTGSIPVTVSMNLPTNCYCVPTYSSGGANDNITKVKIGTWENSSTGNNSPYYTNYVPTQPATLAIPVVYQAQQFTVNVTMGSDGNQYSAIWIDLNQDGTFATTEYFTAGSNAGASGTANINITIPNTSKLGLTRMRVRGGDDSQPGSDKACGASSSNWGEAEDYNIYIRPAAPTLTTTPGINACVGDTVKITATSTAPSPTFLWTGPGSFTATGATLTFNNATAAINGVYTAKVVSGPDTSLASSITITVSPYPTVNLGNDTTFCGGNTLTLTAPAGNTYLWSNNATTQTLPVTATGQYWVRVTNAGGCAKRDTINVTVNPQPVVNLGNDTTFCAGNMLVLAAPTGFSYLWNSGATSRTIDVIATGQYSVKVTNTTTGCFKSDTINVTVSPLPMVNLGNDTAFCEGNVLHLTAPAGNTYLWNMGATSQTIDVIATGQYAVRVTSPQNCISRDTINVVVNPYPSFNLGNDTVVCYTGTGLTLSTPTGTGYTYLWSTGATTRTIVVNNTGQYWAKVTNPGGCFKYDTINVIISPVPVVKLGNDTAICAGNFVTLNAPAGTGYTYQWSNGLTGQFIYASTTGQYWVKVTNANGCERRDTMNLTVNPLPVTNLGPDVQSCVGNTVSLAVPPVTGNTYLWSNGVTTNGVILTTTGNYSVRVTSPQGCIKRDTVMVTFNVVPVVNLGPDATFCSNDPYLLTAPSGTGYTYLWNMGATAQSIDVTTTGQYSVKVTNQFNCFKSDTINLTMLQAPIVNLGNDTSVCISTPLPLNAGAGTGYTYLWNTGATTQNIAITNPGTYWVRVLAPNGCSESDTITLQNDLLPVIASMSAQQMNDSTMKFFSNGVVYADNIQWFFGDGETSTVYNPTHTYHASGTYTIKAVVYNHCGTDTVTQVISIHIKALGVDDVNMAKQIRVYPNPASDRINIDNPQGTPIELVTVTNVLGATVLEVKPDNSKAFSLEVNNLLPGMYSIILHSDKGNIVKKVQIRR